MSTSSSRETRVASFPISSNAAGIVTEQHFANRRAFSLAGERPIVTAVQRPLYDFLTELRGLEGLLTSPEQRRFMDGAMAAHLLLRRRLMAPDEEYTMLTYSEVLPAIGAEALTAVRTRIGNIRQDSQLARGPGIVIAACRGDYSPNIAGGLQIAAAGFVAHYEPVGESQAFSAGLATVASAFEEQYRIDHPLESFGPTQ